MQTVQAKQSFDVLATFTVGITHSTAPQYKYPNISDVLGVGNKSVLVTKDNQNQFTAPYELDEITLLAAGFENRITLTKSSEDEEAWLLDVVDAHITSNKLTVIFSLSIVAEDEDQAIEVLKNELKGYELSSLEFRENDTDEIYYIEVDSIHNGEWDYFVD